MQNWPGLKNWIKTINFNKTLSLFSSATIKLTLFYVLIVMAISVIFSVSLYDISSNELERGLGRQVGIIRNISRSNSLQPMPDFNQIQLDQLDESNRHLKMNLVYFNLLILFLSSLVSYILAKKTLEPIEEAMNAQNRFTADASHELRTPLTAMRSEIEVALRNKNLSKDEAKKLLSSNLEEIDKLESLSNALLKLACYQDDKNTLTKISLEEIIVNAYEKIETLANQKDISFENELLDLKVKGDKASLTELFVILLENAIKYSPKSSKISISMKKDRDKAVIFVQDQGIGIKASDLPHIFNRFYRADNSRSKEKAEGYGLGLAIAKQIANLHDGSISVESKPGQGSKFTIKLDLFN